MLMDNLPKMIAFFRSNIFQIICFIAILTLAINRLFHGVEITDESYYLSTSYRYIQGNIPFYDAWDGTIGSALLFLPALALYSFISGGTEGIFLFSRLSFFCIMLIIGFIMYFSIKPTFGRSVSCLAATVLIVVAPFSLYNWSYNNLALSLLCAGLFLLAYSLNAETVNRERLSQILAGMCFAFMTFAHISQVFTCITVAIFYTIFASINKKSIRNGLVAVLFAAIGGVGTAVLLVFSLLVATQGNLFSSLSNIMSNPWMSGIGNSMPDDVIAAFKHIGDFIFQRKRAFVLGTAWILSSLILKKRWPYLSLLTPLFAFMIFPWLSFTSMAVIEFVAYCGLFWILWIPFIKGYSTGAQNLYWMLGAGGLFGFIAVSVVSGGGAYQGKYMLFCLLLAILVLIIDDIIRLPRAPFKRALACAPALLLSGCLLFLWYQSFYRESPYAQLTTRVDQGVYKGMYTTPERADYLVKLENELITLQDKGGGVLFLGTAPHTYLMVDMKPTTPTTWRVNFEPGYDTWFPVYYAQGEGFKPDQIIFLDESTYLDYLTYQDLELSKIIKNDYILSSERSNGAYHIYLFIRKLT